MSARDDYPAGDLLSGRATVYDRLWSEIDRLRAEVERLERAARADAAEIDAFLRVPIVGPK